MAFRKRILLELSVTVFLATALAWQSTGLVRTAAAGRVFRITDAVPHARAALVLGCAPELPGGAPNSFFLNRMSTAALLYRNRKVDLLLVSGDNHSLGYDEPTRMKEALVRLGVPEAAIVADYAGFSTLDSVVRAREVFGLDEFVIVSQKAHLERAIFLADHFGLRTTGVMAADVGFRDGIRTRIREVLARVRAVLDVSIFNRRPHFLGPKIVLPDRVNLPVAHF